MKISELIEWLAKGLGESGDLPVAIMTNPHPNKLECNEDIRPVVIELKTPEGDIIKSMCLTTDEICKKYETKYNVEGEDTDAASQV